MPLRDFNFDLYRLTIHDEDGLLPFMGKAIRTNEQIAEILKTACHEKWDHRHEARKAVYLWSLRNFVSLHSAEFPESHCFAVTLAKATLERDGVIVTPVATERGTSQAQPPLADVVTLIFQMNRHLVAVEFTTTVTASDGWLKAIEEILRKVARNLQLRSTLQLNPKPQNSEILKTFLSFQKLTRIRVQLLLPNPDFSHLTEKLYRELENGDIREFLADMRNPGGLSQAEQTLPHSAVSMAEEGYKKGDVLLEGYRNGKKETLRTGERPARGKVENMKEFVRGMGSVAKTKEGKQITDSILREIERLAPEEQAE